MRRLRIWWLINAPAWLFNLYYAAYDRLHAVVWCFLHDRDRYNPFSFDRCLTWYGPWSVKNLFEIKSANYRIVNRPEFTAGAALLIKSGATGPAAPRGVE